MTLSEVLNKVNEQFATPPQNQGGAIPQTPQDKGEWDYKSAPLDPQGNPLPEGAQGWTPFGQPYFGPGIGGTLKRYWWTLSGKPTSGAEGENWAKLYGLAEQLNSAQKNEDAAKLLPEFLKRQGAALLGGTVEDGQLASENLTAQNDALQKQMTDITSQWMERQGNVQGWKADTPQEIKDQYKQLSEQQASNSSVVQINGKQISLAQPLIHLTDLGMQVIGDVFQEASVKLEQGGGAALAASESATERGGLGGEAPTLRFQDKENAWLNGLNTASRVLFPQLAGWDSMRLLFARGDFAGKQKEMQVGFDAGRILYSQVIKPAVFEEAKRRIAAGEDAQLVAMELENPWAEMVGRTVFDPLWATGALEKAGALNKVAKAVEAETTGTELAVQVGKVLEAGKGAVGEARAAEIMNTVDDAVIANSRRLEKTLVTNLNNPLDYSPSGLRLAETKVTMRASNNLVGGVMRGGGSYDDVADIVTAGVKSLAEDKATRLEGVNELMNLSGRFNLGRYAFSDDAQKTFIILKNLTKDGGVELMDALKAARGDPAKMADTLSRLMQKAVENQVPLMKDLKAAEKAVKTGQAVTDKTAELAKQYEGLTGATKAAWNLEEGTVGNFKRWTNKMLSTFYFSTPGFVARNTANNFVTMLVDIGPVKTAKAMLWKVDDIDKWAGEFFGGKAPPAFEGFTLIKSQEAKGGIAALNDRVESSFAKRIYWSRFRESMDSFLQPGVTLPSRAEFKAAGMTEEQINHFVHILRGEAAGNVEKAVTKYAEKYGTEGLDAWKAWNGSISPQEMKGLKEFHADKKIDELVNSAQSPQEIRKAFDTMKADAQKMAQGAEASPVQDVAGVGKAVDQGFLSVDDYNQLNILESQYEAAADAVDMALDSLNKRLPQLDLTEYRKAFSRTAMGNVRREVRDMTDTAWTMTRQARNATASELRNLWQKSIIADRPVPANLTSKEFLNQLWQETKARSAMRYDAHFSGQFQKVEQFITGLGDPEVLSLFKEAQTASAKLQLYRNATYQGGKILAEAPVTNVRQLASKYGIATATESGKPADQHLLAAINKELGTSYKKVEEIPLQQAEQALKARAATKTQDISAQTAELEAKLNRATDPKEVASLRKQLQELGNQMNPELAPGKAEPNLLTKASSMPRSELPQEVSDRIAKEADVLIGELREGQAGQRIALAPKPEDATNDWSYVGIPSTNAQWYKDLYKQYGIGKPEVNKALDKIIADAGKDKGVNVERLKDVIIDRLTYGDQKAGVPPDLYTLKHLGAPQETLDESLKAYNYITGNEYTLEDALVASGAPIEEVAQYAKGTVRNGPRTAEEFRQAAEGTSNPAVERYHLQQELDKAKQDLAKAKTPHEQETYTQRVQMLTDELNKGMTQLMPPEVKGVVPTPGQMANANHDGLVAVLDKVQNYMLMNYGIKSSKLDGTVLGNLRTLMTAAGKDGLAPAARVNEAIAMADKIGTHWRDFALLPYGETKNFDLAASFVFPYQFWYSRSYANWMQRVAQDAPVVANYARLKDTMAKMNKDAPEWWRYNVTVPSHFLGLPIEHPMSFNLEASIWPLYGITGVDFNDPDKRVNWWTSTVDDMGKFGPSLWTPFNLAIATVLNSQGQKDAAARWAGKLFGNWGPTVKAVASKVGIGNLEVDPLTQMFSGNGIGDFNAVDPYERNRVGRMLAAMAQQDPQNEAAYIEAARTQSGPLWEEAIKQAVGLRSTGQIMSFGLGVGAKARTEEDKQIDQFYQDYHRTMSLIKENLISPDQTKQAFDSLRQQYPFMDTLLLSRKAGLDRDRAYAYNIISRVAPGQLNDLYKVVGIDRATADKFWNNKGDLSFMSDTERQKFISSMVDLGTMLAIPDNATRQDWTSAKTAYKDMQSQLQMAFGENINDKITTYYNLDSDAARQYREDHPEVGNALQYQNALVVQNPLLYQYYGGIKTLESYEYGKMYDELEKKYGSDIQTLADQYNRLRDLQMKPEASAFLRQYPQITAYFKDKSKMTPEVLRNIAKFSAMLPEASGSGLSGATPQNPSQEAIQGTLQGTPARSFQEWQQELGPSMTNLIADYFLNGKKLPYSASNSLDYLAGDYGYKSANQLLEAIGLSIYGK